MRQRRACSIPYSSPSKEKQSRPRAEKVTSRSASCANGRPSPPPPPPCPCSTRQEWLHVFDPERAPELSKGRGHDGTPLGVREVTFSALLRFGWRAVWRVAGAAVY
jgi:hypothetical protein